MRMVMRMADVKMRMEKKYGKVVEARGLSDLWNYYQNNSNNNNNLIIIIIIIIIT